jgi:hypothetical protein
MIRTSSRRRMAKPGVVLRRPVGSEGAFGEHAELPKSLGNGGRSKRVVPKPPARKAKKSPDRPDEAADRKAALAYELERKRREREEATSQKERERKQQAVDKAQAAFDKAKREHAKRAAAVQAEMNAIEKKARAEDANWGKERGRQDAALRRARG